MVRLGLALTLALTACSHSSTKPVTNTNTETASTAPRHWRVYDGDVEILEIKDEPGPLTSTALPPPGAQPVMHPFLTASALDAGHEDQLRTLLLDAKTTDEFVASLQAAGFRVSVE